MYRDAVRHFDRLFSSKRLFVGDGEYPAEVVNVAHIEIGDIPHEHRSRSGCASLAACSSSITESSCTSRDTPPSCARRTTRLLSDLFSDVQADELSGNVTLVACCVFCWLDIDLRAAMV